MPHATRRVIALVAIMLAAPLPARAEEPVHLGSLSADESVFWDDGRLGTYLTHSAPAAPSVAQVDQCTLEGEACTTFTLDLAESGEALRIAYDTPSRDDNFEFLVTDPNGTVTRRTNGNQYSVEVLLPDPAPGRWTLRLAPYSAEEAPFRLRAKLEGVHHRPQPDAGGYLLPNLRVTRLWEFGFIAPANPLNGLFPPDDINPPLSAAGVAPLSCALDEMAEDGAQRCLRFSFGLANDGDGVFDVRWTNNTTGAEMPMTQCLQRAEGPPEARAAGTGAFHTTHGHWHYNDVFYTDLQRVLEPGLLEPAGTGRKLGYSPADQGIADWTSFTQAPSGTSGGAGNCAAGADRRLGMSAGWGDAYRYQRPGNYVEFGTNPDGEYVVRGIADPMDNVVESDETDNISYAHVRVTGSEVEVLETGLGQSPWDPDKVVYPDWWVE